MVWKKQQLVEAFRKEKLEQLIGCVCVCGRRRCTAFGFRRLAKLLLCTLDGPQLILLP